MCSNLLQMRNMKKILFIIIMLIVRSLPAWTQIAPARVPDTKHVSVAKEGNYLAVKMNMDLRPMKVESNRAVLLTPVLVHGDQNIALNSVAVYGHRRYIYYQREYKGMLSGNGETMFKASEKPDTLPYHMLLPWQEWMDGATLELRRNDFGCCHTVIAQGVRQLHMIDIPKPFIPQMAYKCPIAEKVKNRSVSGHAFIDFPVNKTVIYPDYRNNTAELAKIIGTIDSVRNDKDITVKSLSIKGFASPESPYSNNTRLAKGRTAALKEYVLRLYHFNNDFIKTSYEPEDWEGLRTFVEQSGLEHKKEILALIDSDMEPDSKERKIKTTYPDEYRFLLATIYPALRHSDYKIDYEIRTFTDIEEIKRLVRTQPQKLSLNEFYQAAQTYEAGSDDYNYVFETAVRMYPSDPIANLNAANSALSRQDITAAEQYLAKSGDSPEADYARGVLAVNKKDYEAARRFMTRAADQGLKQAEEALVYLSRFK